VRSWLFTTRRGRIRVRGWQLAAAVVALALVATAGFASTTKNSLNRGVVMFVGDSNVSRAGRWTVNMLTGMIHVDNNYVPVFVAHPGAGIRTPDCLQPAGCTTTNFWTEKLSATFAAVTPDVIVLDLGINDSRWAGTETSMGYSSYGAKIDWLMRQLPDVPVLWTNFPCRIEPVVLLTGCRVVNVALLDARARWPRLTIVDWGDLANRHPEWIDRTPADVSARLHYTSTGYKALGHLETITLDGIFPPP
jgi:GDSL-like Lipase/Acylhydrolase family